MTPSAPYEKSKSLGSGGSMVARLKLKEIDGRAPPGYYRRVRPHSTGEVPIDGRGQNRRERTESTGEARLLVLIPEILSDNGDSGRCRRLGPIPENVAEPGGYPDDFGFFFVFELLVHLGTHVCWDTSRLLCWVLGRERIGGAFGVVCGL